MGLQRMPGALGRMFSRGAPVEEVSPAPAMEVAGPERSPAIPEDWRDLSWQEMRSLAAAHSDEKVVTKADAERAILAALAKEGNR